MTLWKWEQNYRQEPEKSITGWKPNPQGFPVIDVIHDELAWFKLNAHLHGTMNY